MFSAVDAGDVFFGVGQGLDELVACFPKLSGGEPSTIRILNGLVG